MRNSLSDVVAAALRVLDAQGLEGCSMRRVAAQLDVQPSALYHHVPDKQTLLALMADDIVRGVGESAREPREFCVELRDAMLAVRDGADVVATAAAFRLGASQIEDRLAELAGPDGARTLLLYTFGHAQSTQTHVQAAALGALLAPARPAISAAAPSTAAPDPAADLDASFGRGLDIILAGLAAFAPTRRD
ncbi:TetR family transcriptional regulator [Leucobacter triazinivorans]|uniref:TetR family transcriptional regulator n=1 Tax=Leucobacter triazinivorans TaxID=1784719 RepID=A0A4P6KEG0_9MICO|nr:TetR family transcriptional regulator [Leucobacter triazinivorans]QBE48825.1 TetR family transcriptional regulator [Leucobacter triazinivorans]